MSLPTRFYYIFSAFLGLCLFILAWSSWSPSPVRTDPADSLQLVVRPVNALVEEGGIALSPSSSQGLFSLSSEGSKVTVEREAWGRQSLDLRASSNLSTVRLKPPLAKLQARTSNGKMVRLQTLPGKEAQEPKDGYIRLEPGRYRFLAQAEGHIPRDLSLELAAGEVRKLTVDLKEIPQAPKPATPVPVAPPPRATFPVQVPRSYQPPPPLPRARPQPRPEPRPLPRFTPVAPRPQPVQAEPAPLFTPLSP